MGVMPKEIIHSRYEGHEVPVISGAPGEVKALREPVVHVGWTRDRDHVEVAVLSQEDHDNDPTDATSTPRQIQSGYYAQMDRDGINRLIRSLRKARDAAFGADA